MIPHSKPFIDPKMVQAVARAMAVGQVSMGPKVGLFEAAFKKKFGLSSAAVSSGTAALHLSLLALKVGVGDEVILPTYVCSALLNAVLYVGAAPVLADVELFDGNISVEDVKKKMSRKTRAIIVPHMFGAPADIKGLLRLGVPVIEDCAQSLGALADGKYVGTVGKINIFSFYATKMMTTGEGGMVVSKDARLMFGVRDALSYDHRPHYKVRFNYKMTDMQAALGVAQLSRLDSFIVRRRQIAAFYTRELKGMPCVLSSVSPLNNPVYYRYVVRVKNAARLILAMQQKGVMAARPLFKPLHYYLNQSGFPAADELMRTSISLPIYPGLSDKDAGKVAAVFKSIIS